MPWLCLRITTPKGNATVIRLPRKRLALAVTCALLLLGAGGALAYWSVQGTGTGAASSSTTTPILANQTSTIQGLAPGRPPQTLSGNFSNPNSGPIYVTNVVASISGVAKAAGAPDGTCDASDYTLTNATMPVGAEVAPGGSVGSWAGATIAFNDKAGVNQDACAGARIDLAYAVN
jgi:hypothetical protein